MDLQKRKQMLEKAKSNLTVSGKNGSDAQRGKGLRTAYQRMEKIFDPGTFVETGAYVRALNNEFHTADPDGYEGVVTGYGSVDGRLVFAYAQDPARKNGAFGKAGAQKICALYALALKNGAPVVAVFDSAGANLLEGVSVLAGYGEVLNATAKAKGKIPLLTMICGDTSGGAAVIAAMGDIAVMTGNAAFSASPVSVLAEEGAPKDAGSATYAAKEGFVTFSAENEEAAFAALKQALSYLPSNRLDANIYLSVEDDPNRLTPEIAAIVASDDYDVHDVLAALADGGQYLELLSEYGKSMVCALCPVNGMVCGIVADNPKQSRVMGEGAAKKAVALIHLCKRFNLPVVTLCDIHGFSAKCEAAGGRILLEAANLAAAYATASVPLVTLNVGAGYGSAFAVMGSKALGADIVYALDTAKISVLPPDAAVSFMWNDKLAAAKTPLEKRKELEEEWALVLSSPLEAAACGQIDDIIAPESARQRIASALEMLSMKREFKTDL